MEDTLDGTVFAELPMTGYMVELVAGIELHNRFLFYFGQSHSLHVSLVIGSLEEHL